MALSAISNFAANVAARNLAQSAEAATRSLAKLSIGSRVVTAKDDAASLAIGSAPECGGRRDQTSGSKCRASHLHAANRRRRDG